MGRGSGVTGARRDVATRFDRPRPVATTPVASAPNANAFSSDRIAPPPSLEWVMAAQIDPRSHGRERSWPVSCLARGIAVRRPRRQCPLTRWFVTTRCARSQYRLRPDATRREAMGYFLGRALSRHPGIRLHAVVQMSNHLHLVLTDADGVLSSFMRDFLGPLAKCINEVDRVRGPFFERRYAATEIVDDAALVERVVYTLTNPVAANLVATPSEWPGLLLGPSVCTHSRYTRFRSRAYGEAIRRERGMRKAIHRKDFMDEMSVRITWDDELAGLTEVVLETLAMRLDALRGARGGRPVLGGEQSMSVDVFEAPVHSKRSPMPLCHASTPDLWWRFREGWRGFLRSYREASSAFRRGVLGVAFPPHSFRPCTRCP